MNSRRFAGVSIPDTPMARVATDLMSTSQSQLLFDAATRCFLFSALIGQHRGQQVDHELLYVGALFLRIGVTPRYCTSQQRFEIDSADAASEFLKGYGRSSEDIAQVWDAIALHTTPGIPEHKSGITALLAAGVQTDLLGTHCQALNAQTLLSILTAFPREPGFKFKLLAALARGQAHRPRSTEGTINADVLSFYDRGFKPGNFCEELLNSTWPY